MEAAVYEEMRQKTRRMEDIQQEEAAGKYVDTKGRNQLVLRYSLAASSCLISSLCMSYQGPRPGRNLGNNMNQNYPRAAQPVPFRWHEQVS